MAEQELSEQTKAEQEAGRRMAEQNAKAFAQAEVARATEAAAAQAPDAPLQSEADAVVEEVIAKEKLKKEKRNG